MKPIFAYLDAGTGAAIAAVVASGAVGARAVLGNAKGKLRRKLERAQAAEPTASSAEARPVGDGDPATR